MVCKEHVNIVVIILFQILRGFICFCIVRED